MNDTLKTLNALITRARVETPALVPGLEKAREDYTESLKPLTTRQVARIRNNWARCKDCGQDGLLFAYWATCCGEDLIELIGGREGDPEPTAWCSACERVVEFNGVEG